MIRLKSKKRGEGKKEKKIGETQTMINWGSYGKIFSGI